MLIHELEGGKHMVRKAYSSERFVILFLQRKYRAAKSDQTYGGELRSFYRKLSLEYNAQIVLV